LNFIYYFKQSQAAIHLTAYKGRSFLAAFRIKQRDFFYKVMVNPAANLILSVKKIFVKIHALSTTLIARMERFF